MNQLKQLTREDIIEDYLYRPILIENNNKHEWYLLKDNDKSMPLHLLDSSEVDLYELDEKNIEGIEVVGVDGDGYLMWIYFEQEEGWKAYGNR